MENRGEEDFTPARGGPATGRGGWYVFGLGGGSGAATAAPVHPGYARWLLSHGKAAVLHRAPFTLILKRMCPDVQSVPLRLKTRSGLQNDGAGGGQR